MDARARRRRLAGALLLVGIVAVLVDLAVSLYTVAVDLTVSGVVYENQGITDLGRDLLAVSVLEEGGMPYQQIGDLISEHGLPDLPLSGHPRMTGWIVHPPVALLAARVLFDLHGPGSELFARQVGLVAVVLLALAVAAVVWRRRPAWTVPVAIGMLVWVPTFTDTVWIQGNAVAGLGLLAVVQLESRGRPLPARILLGLLTAWKPWLAVFALALPRSVSAAKDLIVVTATAVLATLAAAPFVGGLEALWVWLTEALPGNNVEARTTPANLSWTSAMSAGLATLVYFSGALAVLLIRQRIPRDNWLLLPIVLATGLAPFVWDHYWLALAPVVWTVLATASRDLRFPVGLWMALAVLPAELARLGRPGLENRVVFMVLAGALLLAGALVVGLYGRRQTSPRS